MTQTRARIILSSIAVAAAFIIVDLANAQPTLRDRQSGKYLGNLSNNRYDANSTSNEFGRYGSRYSPESINNPYSKYGSRYSNDSPNNPYATNAPAIVIPCYGC